MKSHDRTWAAPTGPNYSQSPIQPILSPKCLQTLSFHHSPAQCHLSFRQVIMSNFGTWPCPPTPHLPFCCLHNDVKANLITSLPAQRGSWMYPLHVCQGPAFSCKQSTSLVTGASHITACLFLCSLFQCPELLLSLWAEGSTLFQCAFLWTQTYFFLYFLCWSKSQTPWYPVKAGSHITGSSSSPASH